MLVGPRRIAMQEFPVPRAGEDDGVLEVEVAGVCGSDVFHYNGANAPIIMGHEIVGRISDIGPGAQDAWGVGAGDRVVVETTFGCGRCERCRMGRYRMCNVSRGYGGAVKSDLAPHLWGGYGQFVYLPPTARVHRISEELPGDVAVLVCAVLGNGVRWLRTIGGVTIGDTAVVVGPGPQGLAATVAAREYGRLQVELAQHEYLLPRLAGQWSHLERLGGGIGTRGPGETQIETDRRLVRGRILKLKSDLELVRRHRQRHRSKRVSNQLPVVSLIGYTNSGKSTLLNRLTRAGVRAENLMFSTLDPVTRRIQLPSGRPILLTDTVGFIHKLPTTLVAAFRATLEEVAESSMVMHLVDVTHRNAPEQVSVVESIVGEIGVSRIPTIMVFNKSDLLPASDGPGADSVTHLASAARDSVLVSAATGDGMAELLEAMDACLSEVPDLVGAAV